MLKLKNIIKKEKKDKKGKMEKYNQTSVDVCVGGCGRIPIVGDT
jgi:hypothetical protein